MLYHKNDNGLENYGKYFVRNLLGGIIMFEHKQNVTIVKGTGREKVYAQMLFQMLSKLPNINSPQPITETEYNKSVVTIGSDGKPKVPNGKIIFFGNGKEAQIQGKSVDWEYNRFGMKYGWMGNRCVITADVNEIKLEEQSKFADYYNSKVEEFKSFIKLSGIDISNISYSDVEHLDMNEIYDEIRWEKDDEVSDKVAKTVAAVALSPLILLARGLKGVGDTLQDTVAIFERKDLWRNQYLLLVLEFAINGFSHFISNIEEKKTKGKVTIVYDTKDAGYSHLLHNFIQQYSEYDVMEFTEKMFIDNAKMFSANNKIIFLGNTKSSKERWLDKYKYAYDKHGMHYGWVGN